MLRPLLAALPLLAHTALGSVVHVHRRDTQGCTDVQSPGSFSIDITPENQQMPFHIRIDGNVRVIYDSPRQDETLPSIAPQAELGTGEPGPEIQFPTDGVSEPQPISQPPQVPALPDSQRLVNLEQVDPESRFKALPEIQPKVKLQQIKASAQTLAAGESLEAPSGKSISQSTARFKSTPSGKLSHSSPTAHAKSLPETQIRVKAQPVQPLAKSQVHHEPAMQKHTSVQSQVHHLPAKPQGNPPASNQAHAQPPKTFPQVHHAPARPQNHTRFVLENKEEVQNHDFIQGLGQSGQAPQPTLSPSSNSSPEPSSQSVVSPVTTVETKTTSVASPQPSSSSSTKSALYAEPTGNATQPSPGRNATATQGLKNTLYFTNWGIYDAKYDPQLMPTKSITHVIYAFANISSDGTVQSSDPWADVGRRYVDDKDEKGNNAYGCIKQLYLQKKENRGLKTLLSVGGWSASKHGQFSTAAATDESRKRFAKSAVKLVTDWGMDGLDVDWEYPSNPTEAKQMVLLLKECRAAFDDYAAANKQDYHYLLTAATPAGPENYKSMDLAGMDRYLDDWNIMAYDYAGTWEKTTGHQANLFLDQENPASTKASTNRAVADYIATGINPKKINIGLPLYGRSFSKTSGFGAPFDGTGSIMLYKDLPRDNKSAIDFSDKIGAAWSYNPDSRELVTYDTVQSTQKKADYILKNGLGGAFFWEASGDKTGKDSLVTTMSTSLGALDDSPNMLDYPSSPYDNIRNGMK
ncbi:hypothetical protein HIM_08003 [Hirsutella minnesotensis 3608]|uniref:chitinase n=1 Tax=Hirsutella minnesotensis 3608 TaxID=1043627 RepID=A0A0F8A3Y6_9HYPO|nr:hypothetical protein HIM_08003 [Hirsutella minnesotensis 3608]